MGVRGGLLCGNEVGTLEEMKAQLGRSLGRERPQGENGIEETGRNQLS